MWGGDAHSLPPQEPGQLAQERFRRAQGAALPGWQALWGTAVQRGLWGASERTHLGSATGSHWHGLSPPLFTTSNSPGMPGLGVAGQMGRHAPSQGNHGCHWGAETAPRLIAALSEQVCHLEAQSSLGECPRHSGPSHGSRIGDLSTDQCKKINIR